MKVIEKKTMEFDVDHLDNREVDDEDDGQATRSSWRSLFNFTSRPHILPLLSAIVFSAASGIVVPALAVFLGKIFDLFTNFGANEISGPDLVSNVSTYGIALVGLGAASGLLNGGYFMLWLLFGELQAKSVREKLFDGMLEKEMEWYDMCKAGVDTLILRLQTHLRELQIATSQPLGFAVQYAVTTLAALGLAFYYSWSLALVTLATVPISAIVLAWISAQMQPSIEAQVDELSKASKMASNAISTIDTVKYFNGQDFEKWQYAKAVKKAARFYLVQAHTNALQIAFVRLVTLGMFVQGFWYGSHLVNTGQKSAGQVLTAFWACLMATQSVEQTLPQVIVLEKGRAAGATLKAIMIQMESGRKVTRMQGGTAPSHCDGDIEVRNLSFSYPSRRSRPALKNANFFFPAGETTFVVGRSGSGKSTLGNLLMRFYTPGSGDLLIDGHSVQTLDLNWLRTNITLVQQQSVLFNETVFKNIAFGRRDHSTVRKGEVKRSIEIALLQHTIQQLPQGLDTVVGTGGNAVSGGQKQRVAIAQARLRDTPILILDEATSALDYISKSLIMGAIREWRHGKSTIIITHDMSQVQENDFVYVLDKGAVLQEGFRHTLEKTVDELGPFRQDRKPVIDSPGTIEPQDTRQQKLQSNRPNTRISSTLRPITPKQQSNGSDDRTSSTLSTSSDDSMDIRVYPRRTFIPSVFSPPLEDVNNQGALDARLLPLSAAAFPIHRRSVETMKIEGQDPRLRSPKSPLEEQAQQNIPALPSRDSTESSTGPMAQMPRRRQNLTEAEKARRTAPLKKILMTIWPALTWKNRLILVLGFFCAAIHAAATPTFSWVFSKLLATFYLADHSERSHKALTWSLSVLGVALVDSLASYSMHYLLEFCGQAWIDTLRIEALKRILDQPCAWFSSERNNRTRLTECLDRNAEEMRNLLGRFASFVFVAVVMMTVAITWSLILCWKLTLVGLASGPFMYAVTRSFEFVSGKWENKSNDVATAASSIFTETFSNIRTVRALTLEGYFHRKYTRAISRAFQTGLKRSAYSGFFFGLSDSGIIFVTALIFYYGAMLASSGECSTQNILTVFTMLLFSIANANAIISFIPQINSSRSTATRLLRLAHLPYKCSHENIGHIRLHHPGFIIFNNITFIYPTRLSFPVLSKLNLTLHPATTTALVGASGSGKSTIASLLLAFYPPTTGALTINGIPISHIHIPTLRSLIAIVPQQPTLFPASIAANIAYALPEASPLASMANIRAAARAAGIDDFVATLPLGYATLIGDGGTGLSGGQAQRIAIARAVVRRPKLLILDEATSSLDGETARGLRDLVRSLERQGVGVVCVTHERAMMEVCRDIVVLKDGGVVERGGFAELLRRGGELGRLLGEI